MVRSILILCIVTMTSFSPVTSICSSELPSNPLAISDFGFSQLIDELVSVNNDSSTLRTMLIILADVEQFSTYSSGSKNSTKELPSYEKESFTDLERHRLNAAIITGSYESIKKCLTHKIICACLKDIRASARRHTFRLRPILQKIRGTNSITGKNFMDLSIENMNLTIKTRKCSQKNQLTQNEIYNIYRNHAIITFKGYAMRIYALNVLREEYQDFISKKKFARIEYQKTIYKLQKSAALAMSKASREICSDEGIDENGKNYIKLKTYLNETRSCSKKCDYHQNIFYYNASNDNNSNDTIRKFSLRAVESDTSKNRVITGLQFVEKNRTIYLRIQDGKLGPKATIDQSTVKWQPIDEINWDAPFINPYDFFTVTNDDKYVNLDTLIVSTDRVLTGIRLQVQGSHLALMIGSHEFNYSTGILKSGFWQSYGLFKRKDITMIASDNLSYMNQTKNTYVTFRMMDLKKGQTIIPFIDAQPVVPNLAVPLSGAGIYYSGHNKFGGLIGLKAVTYDLTKIIAN